MSMSNPNFRYKTRSGSPRLVMAEFVSHLSVRKTDGIRPESLEECLQRADDHLVALAKEAGGVTSVAEFIVSQAAMEATSPGNRPVCQHLRAFELGYTFALTLEWRVFTAMAARNERPRVGISVSTG
jgi:hypothetical protein